MRYGNTRCGDVRYGNKRYGNMRCGNMRCGNIRYGNIIVKREVYTRSLPNLNICQSSDYRKHVNVHQITVRMPIH